MKSPFLLGWALVVLLGSCRSQQAAFQFRSVPPAAATAAAPATPDTTFRAVAVSAPALSSAPTSAAKLRPPQLRHILPPVVLRPAATTASATKARPLRAHSKPQRQRPQQAQLEHAGAFVLGFLLVAGGVAAGIVLGGWTGLGVGALVVLAGYYFLGVGIGGKHAWLEVFQEFFNM